MSLASCVPVEFFPHKPIPLNKKLYVIQLYVIHMQTVHLYKCKRCTYSQPKLSQ